MADGIETWMIAVIAVGASIFLLFLICCVWRCCCRQNHKKTFRWIDRLGIPFAQEGQPTEEELGREKKLRVTVSTLNRNNPSYEVDEENQIEESRPRVLSEPEEPEEPFKRLHQLGIPRARREATPISGRKLPNAPLPSPDPLEQDGETSSDEDISIHQ